MANATKLKDNSVQPPQKSVILMLSYPEAEYLRQLLFTDQRAIPYYEQERRSAIKLALQELGVLR